MNIKNTIKNFEKNFDRRIEVKLENMKNSFKNISNIEENPIIYEVFIKKYSPINLGLTVLNSGTINGEYYMTRGHIHKKSTPEFYILLEGKGILFLQNRDKTKTIKLKKNKITLIPESYAHRLINAGNEKLKTLTIYDETSMPNYKVGFKKRFFRK